jgi:hypothetical protein
MGAVGSAEESEVEFAALSSPPSRNDCLPFPDAKPTAGIRNAANAAAANILEFNFMLMISPELLVTLIALLQRPVESTEMVNTKTRLPEARGDQPWVVSALAY